MIRKWTTHKHGSQFSATKQILSISQYGGPCVTGLRNCVIWFVSNVLTPGLVFPWGLKDFA